MASLPKSIVDLVGVFERLPGIGPKSATRLAFYLLNAPNHFVEEISRDLLEMKKSIKICRECFGVSETDVCKICADDSRDKSLICVVERAIDVMAIENLGGYKGVYHVLGGTINPLNHVGPEDLKINELIDKIENREVSEIILATNPTMEGEATALYINKKVESQSASWRTKVKVTRIGSGLPMGADLEFADQATLNRAMEGRRQI